MQKGCVQQNLTVFIISMFCVQFFFSKKPKQTKFRGRFLYVEWQYSRSEPVKTFLTVWAGAEDNTKKYEKLHAICFTL